MNKIIDQCRVCESSKIKSTGAFKPYREFNEFNVYECEDCLCRFVKRDEDIHDNMHASQESPYAFYDINLQAASKFFTDGHKEQLRIFLSHTMKYKFIIDYLTVEVSPDDKILELGCATGFLTSYFLMEDYQIVGVDISKETVNKARSHFGDHFEIIDDCFYQKYDSSLNFVYFVGTIGCVDSPIKFIRQCLKLLKPGGKVLFNAPNVAAAKEHQTMWTSSALPPDLITLFDERFWSKQFSNECDINILYEPYSHYQNAKKQISRCFKPKKSMSHPKEFYSVDNKQTEQYRYWKKMLPKVILSPGTLLSKMKIIQNLKDEIGQFVILTKK